MVRIAAVECLIFSAAGTLIANKVGPSAAQTRWSSSLVSVDHNVMLSRLLKHIEIVVVHRLAVVEITTRDNVAHVSAFHSIISVVVHELIGLREMTFIVDNA